MYAVVTVFYKDKKDDIDVLLVDDIMTGIQFVKCFVKDMERICGDNYYENVLDIETTNEAKKEIDRSSQGIYAKFNISADTYYEKMLVHAEAIDVKGGDKYIVFELDHDGYDVVRVHRTNTLKKAVEYTKENYSIRFENSDYYRTNMFHLKMDQLDFEFEWNDNLFFIDQQYGNDEDRTIVRIFKAK